MSANDITYSHQSGAESQYEEHQPNVQYVTVQPQVEQYQDEKGQL